MSARTRDAAVTGGLVTLPRVNLIPAEIAEGRQLRRVQLALGGAGVAAVAVVVALYLLANSSVSTAQGTLNTARTEHTGLQTQVNSFGNVKQTYALVDQAHGLLRDAGGNEVLWSSYLNDISLRTPDTVWLTKVTVSPAPASAPGTATAATTPGVAQISFEGVALSQDDVAAWLDSVAQERGWSNPYFSTSDEKLVGTRQTYAFVSTVTVTAAALSGRYTKAGS